MTNDETAAHHTRAQNHPDKQKSRYMSRIGGCSPALAAIIYLMVIDFLTHRYQ